MKAKSLRRKPPALGTATLRWTSGRLGGPTSGEGAAAAASGGGVMHWFQNLVWAKIDWMAIKDVKPGRHIILCYARMPSGPYLPPRTTPRGSRASARLT